MKIFIAVLLEEREQWELHGIEESQRAFYPSSESTIAHYQSRSPLASADRRCFRDA
ncbi:hypothetical protein BY996DRAFT_6436700 [Phakopsora pachyrhizi]|nr:hypothetical protein BY996DRAFT_6436700 [Phakopsora pachyrhizi]